MSLRAHTLLILLPLWAGCGSDGSTDAAAPQPGDQQDAAPDSKQPDASVDAEPGVDAEADALVEAMPDAIIGDAASWLEDAEPPADAQQEPEAGPPPAVFSFVAIADTQFATNSCTSGVSERLALPRAIAARSPAFVIEAGDLMDHGYEDGAYDRFRTCYDPVLSQTPFFPTMGNHDAGNGAVLKYKEFLEQQLFTTNAAVVGPTYSSDFVVAYEDDPTEYSTSFNSPSHRPDLPSGVSFKTFYAFRYQNSYFISFEIGTRWWSNTPKSWVEKHLQAARSDPSIEHVFVFMHHPLYSTTMAESSSSGECIEPVRRNYEALFRQYDVTLVFAGHAHMFERFYVPDDGSSTRASPPPSSYPHDGTAVHYMIIGGGGGPLPSGCNPTPGERQEASYNYTQNRRCGYHYAEVQVQGGKLEVQVVGVDGTQDNYSTEVWESFTIE